MEHAIGTRITFNDGKVIEAVEGGASCAHCFFENAGNITTYTWKCQSVCGHNYARIHCKSNCRTDGKNIIYKEIKEK